MVVSIVTPVSSAMRPKRSSKIRQIFSELQKKVTARHKPLRGRELPNRGGAKKHRGRQVSLPVPVAVVRIGQDVQPQGHFTAPGRIFH
jgi:hypothetical protein